MNTRLLFLLMFLGVGAGAQKYDALWMIGYGGLTTTDTTYSITNIDFRSTPNISIFNQFRAISLQEGGSSISDKYGEIQFFSNGMQIRKRNNLPMVNGIGLNPGQPATDNSYQGGSYPVLHGSMIIPKPDDDSIYYLFHTSVEYGTDLCFLYYTVIDMRLDNGLGAVIDKNHIVKRDTFVGGSGMSTCKHANGRDWWFTARQAKTNCFFTYLLTPSGLDTIGKQCIGDTINVDEARSRASSTFTPDGSKYIWGNAEVQLNVADFDRCSGSFSNHRRFNVLDSAIELLGGHYLDGVAVSPNSRYLYVSTMSELRQYDLTAVNIEQTEVKIANVYTGANPTTICFSQLAPDGKIYLVPYQQDTFLHVINYPDLPGLSCGFVRDGLELPSSNHTYLPYYPHYRLGPLANSVCDSLPHVSIEEQVKKYVALKLFPNPTTDFVTIDYGFTDWSKGAVSLELVNALGQTVYTQALPQYSGFQKINIAAFASGLYQAFIKRGAQTIATGKFVKE